MIVDRLETRATDDAIERAARLRWSGGEAEVRVGLPPELAGDADDASPFLPLALLVAMRRGEDLTVDAPVSPLLLRGAGRARELYRSWAPPLHDSRIEVAEERAPAARGAEIGSFFSRGVDSTYSAAVPRNHPGPLERLVFVDGLAPEHDERVSAEELRRARLAAERLGLPLSVVSASFLHALLPAVGNLDDATAPMLALAALGLGGGLRNVLIPASDSAETLGPFGSTPALDRLFSTEAVALETDSVALGRVAKTLWLARERPNLLAQLKVCYEENRPDNCGRCSKCLLTMGALRAAGALAAAEQFPDEVDLELIAATPIGSFQPRVEWAELARAVEGGRDPELHAAVLAALAHPGRPYPGPPPRDDTPDFRARHNALVVSVVRDRVPWPPPAPFAGPPGRGLVRAVDERARRHVYGVGCVPPGALAAELGSLPRDAAQGLEPLWMTGDGLLVTGTGGGGPGGAGRPGLASTVRWALAPLAWRAAALVPRARLAAVAERAAQLGRGRSGRSTAPVALVGYLHREPQPGRLPLLAALHPVTGDQLLATNAWEPIDMGYGRPLLLGYLDAAAPVTGSLEPRRPRVAWASRLGQRVRAG